VTLEHEVAAVYADLERNFEDDPPALARLREEWDEEEARRLYKQQLVRRFHLSEAEIDAGAGGDYLSVKSAVVLDIIRRIFGED
jgi:hypothetical protein